MAIKAVKAKNLKNLDHIAKVDEAIGDDANYPEYLKTGDVTHLNLKAGVTPTYITLSFEHSGKTAATIRNNMMSGVDDDGKPKVAIGSWQYAVAKKSIKGIRNPLELPLEEAIPYKADDNGDCSDDTIDRLDKHGIVSEIFAVYLALVVGTEKNQVKN